MLKHANYLAHLKNLFGILGVYERATVVFWFLLVNTGNPSIPN